MANPIDTLRKLKGRSLNEIRVRGEQAIAVRTEQIGLSGKLPGNEEFLSLIDKSRLNEENITPETLRAAFYKQSSDSFFQSFADKEKTLDTFRGNFGGIVTATILDKAERIIEGRFDLLGYQNLDFGGENVDWHFEPVARKKVPLKHWKQFDELATDDTGDKKIIWELNRHQYFFTLGQAYWLTGDERYAETFARHLDDWIMQNPPGMGINWASSLEVAFRAISWIWAFQFFKDSESLTPALFHNALRYLFLHGRHIEKYLSTYYSPNTHLTGEALGLYYLGTQLKFFTRSEHWQQLGEEILLAELDRQIMPDGVYFEQSTWYQRYTADFYTHFLILKKLNPPRIDRDFNKTLDFKLQQILDFLMYITRPDGTTPLIGDDDGGRSLPLSESEPDDFRYTLATASVIFDRGDYKFVARKLPEETLWLLGTDGAEKFENLKAKRPEQTSRGFTSGGYFVMRDGWAETDNYLLIDGGNLGDLSGGHSHADTLMIDCAAGGRTLLADAGTYTYHESEELRDYFRSTMAHNTLSIANESSSEPGGKFNWKTRAKAHVKSWISDDRFEFFDGWHDGYDRLPDAAAMHKRSVLFLKNDYWIIRDFVKTTGVNSYQQNFHFINGTDPLIEATEAGNFCVSEKPDKEKTGLRIFTFGDNGGWQRKAGWISNILGKKKSSPFLRYTSRGIGSQEFFTFLLPVNPFEDAPEVAESEINGGRAFVINYRDYQDLLVFADSDDIIRTEFFDTNFRFLWARLSADEALPDEYVMIDGTKFVLGGKEIINHPQTLKFATARRLGSRLNIRTSESFFSRSV